MFFNQYENFVKYIRENCINMNARYNLNINHSFSGKINV